MSNVKTDGVKCRRGRPKGTKKPFWNFSSAKSKASGKKRKASDDLQNQQKHFKSEDNACNKNSKTVQKDKVIMQILIQWVNQKIKLLKRKSTTSG